MVDTKKEQKRYKLHRAIWAIADELRGMVYGWDFKNYVLGTMFYQYISENICYYVNSREHAAGNADFDFVKLSDGEAEEARTSHVEEKGFFILPSVLFCNVTVNAIIDENLNETLESVFNHTKESTKGSEAENNFADFDEVKENNYNLSVFTYVETKDAREVIDIVKLNAEIEKIVMHEDELRETIHNIIKETEVGV